MNFWRAILAAILLVLGGASAASAEPTPFAVGQIWTLNDPAHAETRVRIGRIEDKGQTIHISLWGAPIPQTAQLNSPLVAGHLPITASALRASVAAQVEENAPETGFEAGYQAWRDARGGVFTITVPEIVEYLVQLTSGHMEGAP